jgi:DNA-binding winged helix-turn-helix (wHTH) protein
MKTLKEAQEATKQFVDTLHGNGFVLDTQIVSQGNRAEAKIYLREMSKTEHEAYLESIKPEIIETKQTNQEEKMSEM